MEEWKDVEGWSGLYSVSNLGNIRSEERLIIGRWGKQYVKSKILKPGIDGHGYLTVNFCINGLHYTKKIHRLVANAFLPNPENKKCVNHKNGVKTDNHLGNLEWNTHSENSKHSHDIGLQIPSKGESHYKSKLTEKQAVFIKYRLIGNFKIIHIARKFKVNPVVISGIKRKITWRHI